MNTLLLKLKTLLVLQLFVCSFTYAQKMKKLTTTAYELTVNVSPDQAWDVLNSYGDVGDFHTSVTSSKPVNDSKIEAYNGCERECTIENGKKDIVVVEKIVEYVEGQYYKYDVTKATNFPVHKFFNTFGVKQNNEGKTVIYVKSEFRLDPGFMTPLAKGKLKKGNKETLLAYKHFMETGEKNVDMKELKKKYKNI